MTTAPSEEFQLSRAKGLLLRRDSSIFQSPLPHEEQLSVPLCCWAGHLEVTRALSWDLDPPELKRMGLCA